MIGALTKQLVNALKFVPTEIEEAFERAEREVGGRGLRLSETVKLLRAALAPVSRAFICIDALDECPAGALYPSRIFQQAFRAFQELLVDNGGGLLDVS